MAWLGLVRLGTSNWDGAAWRGKEWPVVLDGVSVARLVELVWVGAARHVELVWPGRGWPVILDWLGEDRDVVPVWADMAGYVEMVRRCSSIRPVEWASSSLSLLSWGRPPTPLC